MAVRKKKQARKRAQHCDIGLPEIDELKVSGESSDGDYSWYIIGERESL
jgi:hypothetical protein